MPRYPFIAALALLLATSSQAMATAQFNVIDYGAVPDGTTNDTAALRKAVEACTANHGGTIVFPAGKYLTGALILGDNTVVQLEPGSELLYSKDPSDSPIVPSRWESTNAYTHAPLIYANGKKNISITGRGTLNGQGVNWWWRNGRYDPARAGETKAAKDSWLALYDRIEAGQKPAESEFLLAADYLRPSLVQFYECSNVDVSGVTLTESPMWLLHPVYCEKVSIHNVTFVSTGPNGDGIDVDSCRDVRISDCSFSTGDDCIVIKSGRDADGRRTNRPTEQVVITNCVMYKGHGAVVVGSETSGGIRDIVASNIVAYGTDRGVRIKSMRGRGNVVENLRFNNFVIDGALSEAIEITTLYMDEPQEPLTVRTPIFRNFSFSNFTIIHAKQIASIHGLPEKSIDQLRFTDITASGTTGFVCDYADQVSLHQVRVDAVTGSPFQLKKVRTLELDGISSFGPSAEGPVVRLVACDDAWLHATRALRSTEAFVEDSDMAPGSLKLTDNDLSLAKNAVAPGL